MTLASGTVMDGTGGFYVHDNTNVVINSAQTYPGITAIDAGKLTTAATIGNNTGAIFLGNGGTTTVNGVAGQPLYANTNAALALSVSGLTLANNITTNKADTGSGVGTGTRRVQTTYGTGTSTLSGTLTLNGGVVFDIASSGTLAMGTSATTGAINSGTDTGNFSHSLTKTGAGTLVLNNTSSTYNGGTFINQGTLSISSNANLGGAGGVSLNGGTLDVGGSAVTLASNHGITVGANGGALNSTINGSGIVFNSANTLSGSGALLLQGNSGTNNRFEGDAAQNISCAITVDNTRLLLNNAGATLGTSAITIRGNAGLYIATTPTATLNNNLFLAGNNTDGFGSIRNSGSGNTTFGGNITLQANVSISGTTATTVTTLNGSISGAFTLQLGGRGGAGGSNGSASYVLNGADGATATSIDSGSLTLGGSTVAQNTMLTGTSGTIKFATGVGTFFASSLAGSPAIGLADTGGTAVTLSVGASQTYTGTVTGGAGSVLTYTGAGEAHFQGMATGLPAHST